MEDIKHTKPYQPLKVTNRQMKFRVNQLVNDLKEMLKNPENRKIFLRNDYREGMCRSYSSNSWAYTMPKGVRCCLQEPHNARWMVNILYGVKMLAFSKLMKYSEIM